MGFHALLMGHLCNGALDVLFNISTEFIGTSTNYQLLHFINAA
jgi:hypothetical protein